MLCLSDCPIQRNLTSIIRLPLTSPIQYILFVFNHRLSWRLTDVQCRWKQPTIHQETNSRYLHWTTTVDGQTFCLIDYANAEMYREKQHEKSHHISSKLLNLLSLAVFHHDLMSPIQYELLVFNHWVSWLFLDGRPMSVKTANDLPRDKQSLLALNHDSWRSNFL